MSESEKRYRVIYTGMLQPDMDKETVKSNLMLDVGLSESKVEELFQRENVVLKRFPSISEAQRLAERFDRAGAICVIDDLLASDNTSPTVGGESSLIRIINKFIPRNSKGNASTGTGK